MPEMNLRQPAFTYSACGTFTYNACEHLQKIKQNTKNQRNRRFTIY